MNEGLKHRLAALAILGLTFAGGARAVQDPAPSRPEPRWIGPRLEPERSKARRTHGGTTRTEEAVVAGLDWLARHQGEDGRFDADGFDAHCEEGAARCEGVGKGPHGEEIPCPYDDALTALAVLAFLGQGHHPGANTGYAPAVERALESLRDVRGPWAQALATEAFAEAAVLAGDDRHDEIVAEMAERLRFRQQPDGAFGYVAPGRPGSDVPYTALVVAALVAARDAGIALPQELPSQVSGFLDQLEERKGQLAYLVDGRRYGYTPTTTNGHLAAAVRLLLQVDRDGARHRAHMALIARKPPVWQLDFETIDVPGRGSMQVQTGNLSMYQWWYGTLATFQAGGTAWRQWFGRLAKVLPEAQVRQGCARGSWNPEGTYERQTGGRVFATALGVLMLEQPYRHRRLR